MSKKYPDISHYHVVVNWKTCKRNYPFMITKATQGTRFVDPFLKRFIAGCESYKIPYFLYVYLNKGNERAQAEFMVKTCRPLVGEFFRGYVLDVEAGNSAAAVQAALNYISGKSYKCMIYTAYKDYGKYKKVISNRPVNCAWWEARYGSNTGTYNPHYPPHRGVDLHQYTDHGAAPGIASAGDFNRLTGTKKETWFTAGKAMGVKAKAKKAAHKVHTKTTKFSTKHTYPALPPRGYYMLGDGYKTLVNYTAQIKRLQILLRYAGYTVAVDGDYGPSTKNAVKAMQGHLGQIKDGVFGERTLKAAKAKYK